MFKAKVEQLDKKYGFGEGLVIVIPEKVSTTLPSRGIVNVKGTINGLNFFTILEPNGDNLHWFKLPEYLIDELKLKPNDTVNLSVTPIKDWPQPKLSRDLKSALEESDVAKKTWESITPLAKHEWIRWVSLAKQDVTRKKRIESIASRFRAGKKRPCCFNSRSCSLIF